ncbi:hypothetical protein GCM10027268_24760 [Brachybacterium huguangmaarense]
MVLDVLVPVIDGRETLRRIRADGDWLPVVLLTEVGETFERAAALDEGADDYLTKPFDPVELMARIRAVLRRSAGGVAPLSVAETLVAGELRLDRPARRVHVGGRERTLTPRAFALLEFFMGHPDEVFTRERLLQTVWGFEATVTTAPSIIASPRSAGRSTRTPLGRDTSRPCRDPATGSARRWSGHEAGMRRAPDRLLALADFLVLVGLVASATWAMLGGGPVLTIRGSLTWAPLVLAVGLVACLAPLIAATALSRRREDAVRAVRSRRSRGTPTSCSSRSRTSSPTP